MNKYLEVIQVLFSLEIVHLIVLLLQELFGELWFSMETLVFVVQLYIQELLTTLEELLKLSLNGMWKNSTVMKTKELSRMNMMHLATEVSPYLNPIQLLFNLPLILKKETKNKICNKILLLFNWILNLHLNSLHFYNQNKMNSKLLNPFQHFNGLNPKTSHLKVKIRTYILFIPLKLLQWVL